MLPLVRITAPATPGALPYICRRCGPQINHFTKAGRRRRRGLRRGQSSTCPRAGAQTKTARPSRREKNARPAPTVSRPAEKARSSAAGDACCAGDVTRRRQCDSEGDVYWHQRRDARSNLPLMGVDRCGRGDVCLVYRRQQITLGPAS